MKITEDMKAQMREDYEKRMLPCAEIAAKHGCSRQRVWQLLKAMGVRTEDHKREAVCCICGKAVQRTRKRMRTVRRVYCSNACYWKHVASSQYQESRQGKRVARQKAAEAYPLDPLHVVHHMDGNQRNNDLSNLVIFFSNSEHMSYHRTDLPATVYSLGERRLITITNPAYRGCEHADAAHQHEYMLACRIPSHA